MGNWRSITSEERGQRIKDAIKAGCYSANEIGMEVGASRNAVIGVATRQGISLPNARGVAPGRKGKRPQRKMQKPNVVQPEPASDPVEVDVEVAELPPSSDLLANTDFRDPKCFNQPENALTTLGKHKPGECYFPMSPETDGADMAICGRRCVEGKSWCSAHMRVVRGKGRA